MKDINSMVINQENKNKSFLRRYKLKVNFIRFAPIILFLLISKNFFINLLLGVGWFFVSTIFFDHSMIKSFNPIIRIWFGVPGSGKTSVAAWLARNSLNLGYRVLSNVNIKDTYKLEDTDLGTYDMSFEGVGAHVIIDEALVKGLYNREFKAFAKSNKPLYFSEHRHMNNMVDVFSQGYDVDLNVKERAGENGLFHLSRLGIKGFVMYRCIKKIFFIRKEDKQFLDGFKYKGLPRILYCRNIWHTFDTNDLSDCPTEQKQWELWNNEV